MSATSDIEVLKLEMRPFVKRSVTTGAGNVGGTTLVDATLVEAAGFWDDCWVLIRTGTYAGELRRVTASAPGTLTLDHTVGGQIAAAIQYTMLPKLPVNVVAGGGLKADLRQVLGQGADIAPGNELLTNPSDRVGRLLGIVYGNQAQLQQVPGTLELITRDDAVQTPTQQLSGQVTIAAPRVPLAAVPTTIRSVTIENPDTNNVAYLGNNTVVAGTGYRIWPGATYSEDIDDLNKVYLTGTVGDVLSYAAVA
jgi:hypothetical protein